MSPSTATPITALPKGHAFSPVSFSISPDDAAGYLAAVGDPGNYGDGLPPLAVVALALGALQQQISLPEGALHTGQEVEHHDVAAPGESLEMRGQVAMRSERQGYVITALDYRVSSARGPVLSARTTIMAPQPA